MHLGLLIVEKFISVSTLLQNNIKTSEFLLDLNILASVSFTLRVCIYFYYVCNGEIHYLFSK
jgi:hypothetical protein